MRVPEIVSQLKQSLVDTYYGKSVVMALNEPMGLLREVCDQLLQQNEIQMALLVSLNDGHPLVVCKVSKAVMKQLSANDALQEFLSIAGGKGGGPPHMAQAGGMDPLKIDDAMNHLTQRLQSEYVRH